MSREKFRMSDVIGLAYFRIAELYMYNVSKAEAFDELFPDFTNWMPSEQDTMSASWDLGFRAFFAELDDSNKLRFVRAAHFRYFAEAIEWAHATLAQV